MEVISGIKRILEVGGYIGKRQFVLPALAQNTSHALDVAATVINSMQVIGQVHQYRINPQFIGLPPNVRSHIEAFIRQSLIRG